MRDLKQIIEKMTLREKLSQLTQLSADFFLKFGTNELTGPLKEMNISNQDIASCGSVLGAIGAENIVKIQNEHLEKDPNKIPLLFMLDVIHGFRTIFPINLALACSFEPELVKKAMATAASEAAASGITVNFAPMADLVRDPRWGRVMESSGEDPYLNSLYAKAFVEGTQDGYEADMNKMAACIKHIAGYGAAEGGRDYNTTEIGLNTFFEFYTPAYKAAIESNVAMAMSSFNALNGIPGTANKWLLKDVLRNDWGFDGVIISDWGAVSEIITHGIAEDGKEAAYKALVAGVDIEMMTSNYLNFGEELVTGGIISEKTIDDAVLRILRLKDKLGLFENPYRNVSVKREREALLKSKSRELAYEAAVKSMVLLKNENDLLPLGKNKKVAVIGPLGDTGAILGGWACTGDKNETVTLKQAFENNSFDCSFDFAAGADFSDDINEDSMNKALAVAQKSDIVIMALGEETDMSGEAASRAKIRLPKSQAALLKKIKELGKPVVTVIFAGRPLILEEELDISDALLYAWFPGTEGGNAVRDLLFGEKYPEARLTMTFPRTEGQIPIYYNHFSTGRPLLENNAGERYTSRYIDIENEPLFPFGYGLGYSKVEYSSLSTDVHSDYVNVFVRIKNIGDKEITETVQCYVKDHAAQVVRPVKALKMFKKIKLLPKEEKEICLRLEREAFSYRMADGKLHFDSGKFTVFAGGNSRDLICDEIYLESIRG